MEFAGHFLLEFDHAVYHGVEGGITADFDVVTGVVFATALADDDFTFFDKLIAEDFNTKAL